MSESPSSPVASAPPPAVLDRGLLWSVSLRALALQACFTYERFQGAGFAVAMLPVLRRLWPDRQALAEATLRHMDYFNTNPVMGTYILGAAARLELEAAAGGPAEAARSFKVSVGGPVAALGDRLMWGTVRPLATCTGLLVALRWPIAGVVVMLAGYNIPHIALRIRGIQQGAARGPSSLRDITSPRFARVTQRLADAWSVVTGLLAGALLASAGGTHPVRSRAIWLIFAALSGLLFARRRLSPTQLALLACAAGLVLAQLFVWA